MHSGTGAAPLAPECIPEFIPKFILTLTPWGWRGHWARGVSPMLLLKLGFKQDCPAGPCCGVMSQCPKSIQNTALAEQAGEQHTRALFTVLLDVTPCC